MIIDILGSTDKRPFILTFLRICQELGDTCLITDDRHYKRLTEDGDMYGKFQNIDIFVTDFEYDDVWSDIGHSPDDYEFVILDSKFCDTAEVYVYIKGVDFDDSDRDVVEDLESLTIIEFGFGKKPITYTTQMFKAVERIEHYKVFEPIDYKVASAVAGILAPHVNMPAKNIIKVVNAR